MFYADSSHTENALRFGDVIKDFPICFPIISKPSIEEPYKIQVNSPSFSVVLSPCCSISDRILSVVPLLQLRSSLFSNPYLAEDPKRINIKIPADKSLPPSAWEGMGPEDKAERLAKGDGYVLVDKFVYDENPLFQEYTINRKDKNISTKYYMIDFRTAVHIQCDKITAQYTPGASKCLQLTLETRDLLRKKIASFFQRIPKEDAALFA